MIRIDRKVCRDILKLTKDYDSIVLFDPALDGFVLRQNQQENPPHRYSVSSSEVHSSLLRLIESGLIEKVAGTWGGGLIFRITPELLHYKSFWFDRFTKTYIAGFISGIATSVVGGLILHFLLGLF